MVNLPVIVIDEVEGNSVLELSVQNGQVRCKQW